MEQLRLAFLEMGNRQHAGHLTRKGPKQRFGPLCKDGVRGGIRTHGPRIRTTSAFAAPHDRGSWSGLSLGHRRERPQALPVQSLHLPAGFPPGLARDRHGASAPQLSPTLSRSTPPFPNGAPNFQPGILCSIQLSYADRIFAARSSGLEPVGQVPRRGGNEKGKRLLAHRFPQGPMRSS